MKSVKELVLTNGQNDVVDTITNWAIRPFSLVERAAVIKGAAGTGKSTVVRHIINVLEDSGFSRIVIMAPTHEAKKVIANLTQRECYTIHSGFKLKPNFNLDEFDIDNIIFDTVLDDSRPVDNADFLIFDECSMINDDLRDYIEKEAAMLHIKVLYVGDIYQLKPVKSETVSLTFNSPISCELTEIVRQENGNPLLELLGMLRNDMINNTSNFGKFLVDSKKKGFTESKNTLDEGYTICDRRTFETSMIEDFKKFKNENDITAIKFVAFTNNVVTHFCHKIRNILFDCADYFTKGDLLTCYKSINTDNITMYNGQILKVTTVEKIITSHKLKAYKLRLIDEDNNFAGHVQVIDPNDDMDFIKKHDNLLHNARLNRAWAAYYGFRDSVTILKTIERGKNTIKKDIEYVYGLTIHKTQGSTYKTVYIDINNVVKCPDVQLRRQLMYVALSRASKNVVLVYD